MSQFITSATNAFNGLDFSHFVALCLRLNYFLQSCWYFVSRELLWGAFVARLPPLDRSPSCQSSSSRRRGVFRVQPSGRLWLLYLTNNNQTLPASNLDQCQIRKAKELIVQRLNPPESWDWFRDKVPEDSWDIRSLTSVCKLYHHFNIWRILVEQSL